MASFLFFFGWRMRKNFSCFFSWRIIFHCLLICFEAFIFRDDIFSLRYLVDMIRKWFRLSFAILYFLKVLFTERLSIKCVCWRLYFFTFGRGIRRNLTSKLIFIVFAFFCFLAFEVSSEKWLWDYFQSTLGVAF